MGTKKQICKRGFKTQHEAKEYERSFLDQQKNSSDISFSSLVENYMEDMSHRLKPTTMASKEHIINTKILPYFSRLRVCDIDTVRIRKWQNEMLSFRDENGRPYSQTYLKSIHSQMSAIMNYAVKHYSLAANPCHAAGAIGKSKTRDMKIWTKDEYERFAAQVQRSSTRVAFDILFYTGIRSTELLALTPADILENKRLSISKNYVKIKGEELFLTPKTPKSLRTISIPDFLYEEIREYISKLYGIQPGDRIFYFTKSNLEKELKRNADRAGLEPIRVHDLRHSHASLLIEMGVNIVQISERLGHESVKTTLDTYVHLYPNKDAALADALNALRCSDHGAGASADDRAVMALTRDPSEK